MAQATNMQSTAVEEPHLLLALHLRLTLQVLEDLARAAVRHSERREAASTTTPTSPKVLRRRGARCASLQLAASSRASRGGGRGALLSFSFSAEYPKSIHIPLAFSGLVSSLPVRHPRPAWESSCDCGDSHLARRRRPFRISGLSL